MKASWSLMTLGELVALCSMLLCLSPTSGPSTQPLDFGVLSFSGEALDCYLRERKLARLCEKRCVKKAPNGRGSVFLGPF